MCDENILESGVLDLSLPKPRPTSPQSADTWDEQDEEGTEQETPPNSDEEKASPDVNTARPGSSKDSQYTDWAETNNLNADFVKKRTFSRAFLEGKSLGVGNLSPTSDDVGTSPDPVSYSPDQFILDAEKFNTSLSMLAASSDSFRRRVDSIGTASDTDNGFPDVHDVSVPRPIRKWCRGVSVSLHDGKLWRTFAECGTEMIINRGGRRMFPHVVFSISGLSLDTSYSVILEIIPADGHRYKFINSHWMAMGMADPGPEVQAVVHSDSPKSGKFWMDNKVSFSKVRLTNNKDSNEGNILLLSMHKYKVVVTVRNDTWPNDDILSFTFDETTFIAVTAYQNSMVTQLKIQNNPFAKAFRDVHDNNTEPNIATSSGRKKSEQLYKWQNEEHQETLVSNSQSLAPFKPFMPVAGLESRLRMPKMSRYESMFQSPCGLKQNIWAQMAYFPWMAMSRQFPMLVKESMLPAFPARFLTSVVDPPGKGGCEKGSKDDALPDWKEYS